MQWLVSGLSSGKEAVQKLFERIPLGQAQHNPGNRTNNMGYDIEQIEPNRIHLCSD